MADLRARGVIKDKPASPEDEKANEERMQKMHEEQGTPWLLIIGAIVGMLALMGALGAGIVWFILTYFDNE